MQVSKARRDGCTPLAMALQNGHDDVVKLLKGKLTEPLSRTQAWPGRTVKQELLCIVCRDSRTEVVLIPCGHRNLCGVCAHQWGAKKSGCPTDRLWVSEIVPLKEE